MKFYSLENAPVRPDDCIYKQSSFLAAIPVILMFGISVTAFLYATHTLPLPSDFPVFMTFVSGIFFGLMGLAFLAPFRATLKPTNWMLRCNQDGLLIKYRSYLNRKLPATDIQVVAISYSEIAWTRKAIEKRTCLESDRGARSRKLQTFDFIDLSLLSENPALAENLQAENKREASAKSHWEDYPVQLLTGGIIRVQWKGIKPGLTNALKVIGRHIQIRSSDIFRTDYATAKNISPEELKQKVLNLCFSGEKFGAIELVKKARRCSTTEAMQFVEKITAENLRSGAV